MSIPRNYREYNCGGYALQTYNWYCPRNYHIYNLREEFLNDLEDYRPLESFYIINLLHDFPVLIPVTEQQVKQRNYDKKRYTVIAFRTMIGRYCARTGGRDFHFLRLGRNGVWYHKRGCQSWIHTIKEEDVYKPWQYDSENSYDAPIHFFLVPLKA